MKPTRPIRQSCNILVGRATDELNLERNGEMSGMKSLCAGYGPKSGLGLRGAIVMLRGGRFGRVFCGLDNLIHEKNENEERYHGGGI